MKKIFFLGFLICLTAGILNTFSDTLINDGGLSKRLAHSFLGPAWAEELLKFLILYLIVARRKEFNEPMDGIVYAVMISLGFATVENIFYVFNHPGQEIQVAIMRMFTAIPLHAACGVILGYFVGLAKFSDNKNILLYKGLFLATLVHGLYNYFIFLEEGWFIFSIIALVVAVYYSKKAISLHQKDSKQRNL